MSHTVADEAQRRASILATYVPRLLEDHRRQESDDRLLFATGTLVSADISGFTALSERLAAFGHEGAEQLTDLLNRCFAEMIDACEVRGGDILKFGGDALLVLFAGKQHAVDAAVAMSEMYAIVSRSWETGSVKRIELGISQGAHSGTIGCSLADAGHLELLVGGPAVSMTVGCEGDAERGEILVSSATAELLPDDWLGDPDDGGARPLIRRRVLQATDASICMVPSDRGLEGLEVYLPEALAEQVVAGVPGEHRQVVVAFVNMSGTDELFHAEGAEAVHRASQQFATNVRDVIEHHPIHLLASDAYVNGTKLILAAGAPLSTDADEDHMLLALRELFSLDTPLPIRAGVNRGHVFVGDLGGPTRRTFTVMGDAVNLAARLMQRAESGEIIASQQVLDRADTKFDVSELSPFHVKGKSEPIRAVVLGEARSVADEDHLGHIGFVGRAHERARLDRLAEAAVAGRGSIVDIAGEAGIGKSRLVREAVIGHPELRSHTMRGGQYARNTPFFMVRGLLRDLLQLEGDNPADLGDQLIAWAEANAPELMRWLPLLALPVGAEVGMTSAVERLADEFRRDRMLAVTVDAIDAALDEPTAILAGDVHLFDPGSLDVIRGLARRVSQRPWLILMTRRSGTEAVGVESSAGAESMLISAMASDEVAELLTAAGVKVGLAGSGGDADVTALVDRSGGNPLFVLELVSAMREGGGEGLPESIESLVTTRIDLLPPRDRVLIRDVAVGGNTVDTTLLATAFDQPELRSPSRWVSLSSFLVQDRPGIYRFRQSIYRDVAYGGLAYRRRREMHLAIGTTLERRRGGNIAAVTPLLSDHFDRARDPERAWRYSVTAGEAARSAFANAEAITLFDRALRNAADAESSDPTARAHVAESLGDVHELMGHYPEAFSAYQASRGALATTEHQARLLRRIGSVRLKEGRLSQSLSWFTRSRRMADGIDNTRTRDLETAETARLRAGALHRQGRLRPCAAQAEIAAASAERTGDQLAMARAFNMVEVAYRSLGRPDAARYSDLALEMFAGSGDLVGEANVLNNRGVRHHFDGQWKSAITEYERSRALRQQAGDVVGEAMVANNIGEILSLQGRNVDAADLFQHACESWQTAGFNVGVGYGRANLAMALARSGDPEAGMALLDKATEVLTELGASTLVSEMAVRRVECHLLQRRHSAALAEAEVIEAQLSVDDGDDQLLVQLLPLLGLAQLRRGADKRSAATLQRALELAAETNNRYVMALTLFVLEQVERAPDDMPSERRTEAMHLLEQLDVIEMPAVLTHTG